jgi:hypothetical protein
MLTAAGHLTCRSCGTSSSSHMPLLVSYAVTVVGAVEGPLSVGWRQAKVGPPLGLAKAMSG